MFGNFYVWSHTVPCCFSEATLSDIFVTSESSITAAAGPIFVVVGALGIERCRWVSTRSHPLQSDSGFCCIFSLLQLWCWYQWNVHVLSGTIVQVQCLYIVWFWIYICYSSTNCYFHLKLMLYRLGSGRTTLSWEPCNVQTLGFRYCATEDLHIPWRLHGSPKMLLEVCMLKNLKAKSTVQLKKTRPGKHSATLLHAWGSYGNEIGHSSAGTWSLPILWKSHQGLL